MEIAYFVIAFVLVLLFVNIGRRYNITDWGSSRLNILDGIVRWYCLYFHRLPPQVLDLPETGPAVLVSNHVSGLDPLVLIAATSRPLRFMIAREQYQRWWLNWLLKKVGCIPVDREKNPKNAIKTSLAALKAGEVLVVFPQGGIVTDNPKKPLKDGAFTLAAMAAAPVYCVRIEGVTAQGFNIVAVFVRSKIALVQLATVFKPNHDQIEHVKQAVHRFLIGSG